MSERVRESPRGIVYSDFDGTAVQLPQDLTERMTKHGLEPQPGFKAFLAGMADSGVDFGGFISKRPAWLRKRATQKSITNELGMDPLTRRTLAGEGIQWWKHEGQKARVLLDKVHGSGNKRVGFIDDKPHRIGHELMMLMIDELHGHPETAQPVHITLGVVASERALEYMERFALVHDHSREVADVDGRFRTTGVVRLPGRESTLSIVGLQPYTFAEGQWFAQEILGTHPVDTTPPQAA